MPTATIVSECLPDAREVETGLCKILGRLHVVVVRKVVKIVDIHALVVQPAQGLACRSKEAGP